MNHLLEKIYGPQSASDNAFTRKARLLQAYYRVNSLKEENCGIGPNKGATHKLKDENGKETGEFRPSFYGNMLLDGESSGKNFFFKETFEYAQKRVKEKMQEETIDVYRLFNNMLSSMPMAFNLFHPLMMIREKNPAALNKMIQRAFPSLPIAEVVEIKIEFIPTPVQDYTNDKSAMDAAIIFKDLNGDRYLISIETKYTDSLGTNKASDNALKYETAKRLRQFTDEGLRIIQGGCIQIYRNYLQTEKYRLVKNLKDSLSIILAPKDHPSTQKEIDSLKMSLKPAIQHKIEKESLENFVGNLEVHCPDEFQDWLKEFHNRYLNFEVVEPLLKPSL